MDEDELQPCPFCGGTPILIQDMLGDNWFVVKCSCGAKIEGHGNGPVEQWNTRQYPYDC
jgi:hypothetical protein